MEPPPTNSKVLNPTDPTPSNPNISGYGPSTDTVPPFNSSPMTKMQMGDGGSFYSIGTEATQYFKKDQVGNKG